MSIVEGATQLAADIMAQTSMPCTSADAILPGTSQRMAESSAAALAQRGAQGSVMLSAVLGVLILAAAAACLLYQRLERQEKNRRQALKGRTGLPEGFSRKPSQLKKPVSTPEGKNGGAAGSSAPETPEQVFTPKQDRHGSRSLDEEGDYDAASVASVPAQNPTGSSSVRGGTSGKGAAVAARAPIQEDIEDGEAHHSWPDGSEYFGEWRNGRPNGRGIFVWPTGLRYEGEWRDGQEHGVGTLVEPDGSAYYGFWAHGRLHGEGVYKPKAADVTIMRDYVHGEKVKEATLRYGHVDMHKKELKDKAAKAARREDKKEAARDSAKPVRPGETIYKGHHSYDLMRNLQLGIIFSTAKSVEQAAAGGLKEPVKDEDFPQQVTQYFPRGEQNTSFKWKDYCPSIFSRLRDAFGIDSKDYLLSLAGDKALREMPSPGKSGSVFFLSDDDRFIIKTVSHEEMLLLLKLIPAYYAHCAENPTTLLTRFFGVHRIKPLGSQSKVRFVVMGNVFPTEVRLHRKYDLKGSTHGRTAGARKYTEPDIILKDLDMDMRLALAKGAHGALIRQIEADAALLARLGVMDYSLLLGVHYPKWGDQTWYPPGGTLTDKEHKDVREAEQKGVQSLAGDEDAVRASDKAQTQAAAEDNHRDHSSSNTQEGDGADRTVHSASGSEGEAPGQEHDCSLGKTGPLGSHPVAGRQQLYTQLLSHAMQDDSRGGQGAEAATASGRAAARGNRSPPAVHFPLPTISSGAALESPFKEASSLGFDGQPPQKGRAPEANGDSRRSADRLNLSDFAQQKRSSVELGMGNISHAANINPGARGGGLRAGRMMSLHSALRAQLGVAVPALSIPREAKAGSEPCLLFFGIVDFLQQYNLRKKGEHAFKSLLFNSSLISVADPESYAERFCKSARDLFVARGADLDINRDCKLKS